MGFTHIEPATYCDLPPGTAYAAWNWYRRSRRLTPRGWRGPTTTNVHQGRVALFVRRPIISKSQARRRNRPERTGGKVVWASGDNSSSGAFEDYSKRDLTSSHKLPPQTTEIAV